MFFLIFGSCLRVNSLMTTAPEWNDWNGMQQNGMNIEPKLVKKPNFCKSFYLIIPTNVVSNAFH